jgi:hypothetical protein
VKEMANIKIFKFGILSILACTLVSMSLLVIIVQTMKVILCDSLHLICYDAENGDLVSFENISYEGYMRIVGIALLIVLIEQIYFRIFARK